MYQKNWLANRKQNFAAGEKFKKFKKEIKDRISSFLILYSKILNLLKKIFKNLFLKLLKQIYVYACVSVSLTKGDNSKDA